MSSESQTDSFSKAVTGAKLVHIYTSTIFGNMESALLFISCGYNNKAIQILLLKTAVMKYTTEMKCVRWCTSIILLGRWRQKEKWELMAIPGYMGEFEANLSYVSPCFKKLKQKSVCSCTVLQARCQHQYHWVKWVLARSCKKV